MGPGQGRRGAVGPRGDTHSQTLTSSNLCPLCPGHPCAVSTPFPATPVAGHRTSATLSTWSFIWRNSGSRTLRTVFFIFLFFLSATVFIRSLKRPMESSRTWLDSW